MSIEQTPGELLAVEEVVPRTRVFLDGEPVQDSLTSFLAWRTEKPVETSRRPLSSRELEDIVRDTTHLLAPGERDVEEYAKKKAREVTLPITLTMGPIAVISEAMAVTSVFDKEGALPGGNAGIVGAVVFGGLLAEFTRRVARRDGRTAAKRARRDAEHHNEQQRHYHAVHLAAKSQLAKIRNAEPLVQQSWD